MNTYVALLLGINIGGKTVKMDALKSAFESMGFQHVRTLLATGNVLFDSEETKEKDLTKQIEEKLQSTFGFEILVILRTVDYLKELVQHDPFSQLSSNPKLRFNVSFLSDQTRASIEVPYESPLKDFRIISMTEGELFSVIEVGGNTTDAMNLIEKKFGKKVTTRNWNTVKKMVG